MKLLLRLRARRRNSSVGSFLEWPAWDMLLDLATVTAEGKHVSVSAICISSGAPQSTALRKLAALEAAGLVRRYLHGHDRRRVCLALTEKGSGLVNELVAEDLHFFSALTQGQRRLAP
ncbi:winged helix DNA-binding protein [Plastoroseomonas arctica]|uniref:Winged helix DNA-binding protein n=1 Tax=Plastoroseomonas arctica TaxID=1509237 RepID=A0AAF1JVY7_9PROT|nr:winged helix DNA-binding protein [Plastoroseomonas arctica]MBR0654141.1 winged helix DNA-binding protein [Plastoroseomonas arctica]